MASWRGMNVFRRTHAVPEGFHCSFCWSFGGIPPSRGQQPSQPITHFPALSRMERLHLHTHTHRLLLCNLIVSASVWKCECVSSPGLWSMPASRSRGALRLLRLAGSPVLCRIMVSSCTLFAKDSGDWSCGDGVERKNAFSIAAERHSTKIYKYLLYYILHYWSKVWNLVTIWDVYAITGIHLQFQIY